MLKSYNPANIPSFAHDEDMEEVRIKTINPLTVEANKLGVGVRDLQTVTNEHEDKIADLQDVVTEHEDKIADLETGKSKEITKWYILPLAGQSNMTGFGEILQELPPVNPRLMQLGMHRSSTTIDNDYAYASLNNTGYGDRYEEYRPYDDCNLKLIPSAPCLDSHHNLFCHIYNNGVGGRLRAGGLVGVGHYLAQSLLKYIPEDYGILIVNSSRGSLGFGNENPLGTYDATRMIPSTNARRGGVGTPFGDMMYDRLKYAMELNPENKLLPIVWFQGESDDDANDHYVRFKAYAKWLRDSLRNEGLLRTVSGNDEDFRWFCFGTPRIAFGENIPGHDHLNTTFDQIHLWGYIRANYDNYAYLMEDPEFIEGANKDPQIISIRIDIDNNGSFFETALQELADAGIPSFGSSQPDWHFSTANLISQQVGYISNVFFGYGKCLRSPVVPTKWYRPVRGGRNMVSTDNVVFQYERYADPNFDPEANLGLHVNFHQGINFTKDASYTITPGTRATVVDPDYGTVFNCTNSSANADVFTTPLINKNYTLSLLVKQRADKRSSVSTLVRGVSAAVPNNIRLFTTNGSLALFPEYAESSSDPARQGTFLYNKSYHGAWVGQWDDWQHLAFVYSDSLKTLDIYLNGVIIETANIRSSSLDEMRVGGLAWGSIANYRVYDKALTKEEVAALYFIDTRKV